jgi:hypothetical protein
MNAEQIALPSAENTLILRFCSSILIKTVAKITIPGDTNHIAPEFERSVRPGWPREWALS